MFLPIEFGSQNKESDLVPGIYTCTCFTYVSTIDALKSMVFKYTRVPNAAVVACDLLIIDALGDCYFRDFMLMPDETWRDSYGGRGLSLASLLPPEIYKQELFEQYVLESLKVGDMNV